MIAFPGMLVPAAQKAGMKVPPDLDNYEATDFPHWHVYCGMQLGAAIPVAGDHWRNAEVIASFSDDGIKNATAVDLINAGFAIAYR